MILKTEWLFEYEQYLYDEEKSEITIEKYLRDIRKFYEFVGGETLTKELIIRYKQYLIQEGYMACSINSMLVAVNGFLQHIGLGEYKVKTLKHQRQIYCKDEKELTKAEYMRLLSAAKKQKQLNLILQTICGTGIRVSELKYFTAEAVKCGEI